VIHLFSSRKEDGSLKMANNKLAVTQDAVINHWHWILLFTSVFYGRTVISERCIKQPHDHHRTKLNGLADAFIFGTLQLQSSVTTRAPVSITGNDFHIEYQCWLTASPHPNSPRRSKFSLANLNVPRTAPRCVIMLTGVSHVIMGVQLSMTKHDS
jgi:hypothetical protein